MNHKNPYSYESLKGFFAISVDVLFNLAALKPEDHPCALLAAQEAVSDAKAMKSLRLGISDILAMLRHADGQQVAALSDRLLNEGAPSIDAVRAWAAKKTGSILSRGRIVSEDEFHQMRNLLDSSRFTGAEAAIIQRMLDVFEFGR